jgi:predicted RNA-binding Zn ribbon-like protein
VKDKPAWTLRPAPAGLALLQVFVNTHAYADVGEQLGTVTSARNWLRENGFTASDLDANSVAELRDLREALRHVALSHAGHGDGDHSASALRHILRSATIGLAVTSTGEALATDSGTGRTRFVNAIAAQFLSASLNGTWHRLKACGNDECAVAFYDHSRNATGRYCTTATCANRVRQRSFRQRNSNATDTWRTC